MSANPKRKPARTDAPDATDHLMEPNAAPAKAPSAHAAARSGMRAVKGAAAPTSTAGIPDLDKIIHERARLAIVSALAGGASQTHNELREVLGLTDGNLSVHARKLEEAGYISCDKDFAGRMPRTTYKLTPTGRVAFERYLAHMEALIHSMKGL